MKSKLEFDDPAPTPSERIKTARQKINMATYLLNRQLGDIVREAKAYEKSLKGRRCWPDFYAHSVILRRRGYILLQARAVFREISAICRAIDDIQPPP